MLLLLLTVSCAVIGSSARVRNEKVCYGRDMSFPTRYTPPLFRGQLYFTPSDGGPRKLLMNNSEVMDPGLVLRYGRGLSLVDLRESDAGTFSAFDERTNKLEDVIILKVSDCSDQLEKYYGETSFFDVSRETEFLEFTPLHANQTKVLWNRSNPEASRGGRGEMKFHRWKIISLTTADSGHYNFRKKDNSLLSRKLLKVKASFIDYETKENARLLIEDQRFVGVAWTVTFTRRGAQESETLIEAGEVVARYDWDTASFKGRTWVLRNGIEIDPVRVTDVGTFKFSDLEGNLAHVVSLTVNPQYTPPYAYFAIAGGIFVFVVIVCSCCVTKCCCKKGSSKRDESAPVAVYYHDPDLPACQSYSAPHQPVNRPASRQPAATSAGPSVNNPVNIHVNPRQVSAPGGQGDAPAPSLGFDCLTSDPKFELKGLTFPSAPPLSSDSGFSDVYTSDKLNFL